jgi:hypothetical protein
VYFAELTYQKGKIAFDIALECTSEKNEINLNGTRQLPVQTAMVTLTSCAKT